MKLVEQRRTGALFFFHHVSLCCTHQGEYSMTNYCPGDIGHLKAACSHDEIRWLLNEEDMSKTGEKLIEKIKNNPQYFNALVDLFESTCELNNQYCQKIAAIRPFGLTMEELQKKMEDGLVLYQKIWATGLFAEPIDFHLSPLLKEHLKKIGISEKESAGIISKMTSPLEDTFSRSAEKSILKIAAEIQKQKISFQKARKQPKIKQMIQEHYDKYYWSACNYFSFSGLGAESIEGLIQAALKQKGGAQKTLKEMEEQKIELIKEKEKLKNKFTFDEDTKLAFKLMEKAGIVYDKRKKSQMNTFFSLGRILKEIAKRKKIDFDLAKYLLPHELKDFTRGKIKIQTLKDRRKYTFIDFNKTPYEILTLDAAKKAEEDIWKHTDLTQNKKEISGLCASEGRVIAKARIISSVKNLGELKQGEILVTGMTTPDYAVALKKAVGIITDDGGITCHAAIIAREMKIPAIVGTKTATKKVKTGDLIDLRAHHGMARILETTSE